jgi:phage shock protein E
MIDFDTLKQLFSDNKIYLVDVREKDEWEKGHLKGAYFMPMSGLTHIDALPGIPRERPLYLYCASGTRAKLAKELLSPYIEHIELAVHGNFEELKSHGFEVE